MGNINSTGRKTERIVVLDLAGGTASFADAIQRAVTMLEEGGVVAIPTDTVYGLAASIHNPEALALLFSIKGRPEAKPLPILLAGSHDLLSVAEPPSGRLRALLDQFWPGGLTVALPALPHVQPPLRAADATVGVRVPGYPATLALLRAVGGALAVTSANLSGDPPAATATGLITALGDRIDLVLDAGPAPGGEASTVVGVKNDRLILHRPGVVPWSELRQTWEDSGGQVEVSGPSTVG